MFIWLSSAFSASPTPGQTPNLGQKEPARDPEEKSVLGLFSSFLGPNPDLETQSERKGTTFDLEKTDISAFRHFSDPLRPTCPTPNLSGKDLGFSGPQSVSFGPVFGLFSLRPRPGPSDYPYEIQ